MVQNAVCPKAVHSLSKTELQSLTKIKLHEHMGRLSIREREHQAEVVAAVCEVARRKLYFDHGFTSLFDYMTKGLEFPNASAQRYIDAARLCVVVPTLSEDIAKGEVNLSQVTIVAKTVRQKKKEEPKFKMESHQAAELFEKIKGEDVRSSQQIIAQELKLEIKEQETARVQANGSVRHEITLSSEQEALFQRIKELISHVHPNPSFSGVFEYLATDYQNRKDPLVAKGRSQGRSYAEPTTEASSQPSEVSQHHGNSVDVPTKKDAAAKPETKFEAKVVAKSETQSVAQSEAQPAVKSEAQSEMKPQALLQANLQPLATQTHFHLEVQPRQEQHESSASQRPASAARRKHISIHSLREVHRRDRSCRHRDPRTGRICGSTFQLQVDHIHPVWAGGADTRENLRLLCATHNQLKYQRETGIRCGR